MTLRTSISSEAITHHTAKLIARQPASSRLKPVLHLNCMHSVGLAARAIVGPALAGKVPGSILQDFVYPCIQPPYRYALI